MSVIPLLIVCGMLVAGGFLLGFLWALRSGQFDDDTTPSWRMLESPPALHRPTRGTVPARDPVAAREPVAGQPDKTASDPQHPLPQS